MTDAIKETVKDYILKEFLPGESPENLTDETALISGGILDSIAVLKMVAFLEEKFGFQFQPHEVDAEYLDTTTKIAELVRSRS
jgi:acyl carrier protein